MYMYMYIYMSRESLNLFIHYQLSADCTIYFTAENSSLFAFSWKPRANDCSMVILGETRFNSAVKLVGKPRIVLFGLRFSVFEIYISPLVLLLTASGPYLLLWHNTPFGCNVVKPVIFIWPPASRSGKSWLFLPSVKRSFIFSL